jgi:hypothetical protein
MTEAKSFGCVIYDTTTLVISCRCTSYQAVALHLRPVRLAYQPPANSTFLSEQTSHQQPANSTFLSEQISTSYQPPANRDRLGMPASLDLVILISK